MRSSIKLFLLLAILAVIVTSVPSNAPYIKAKGRPLNIAHRGLCSILPQNTLEAFEAALYQGADFIQLDVVYTQQKQLLVMHDPFLTRITNIRQFPQFANKKKNRVYNGKLKSDWWTDTFKLQELRKLGIKQDQAPGRISRFDFKFTFPLLSDVIQMCMNFNKEHQGKRNPDGRLAGILIQAKDSQMYRDLYDLEIGQTILEVLRKYNIDTIDKSKDVCPIYLHSFDFGTIKYWHGATQLPRNYLVFSGQDLDLEEVNNYATGIGFEQNIIWSYQTNSVTQVLSKTRDFGMQVHVWTFKDDAILFNSTNNLKMYEIGQKIMKLDGVITQFADIYAPIAQLYKETPSTMFYLTKE